VLSAGFSASRGRSGAQTTAERTVLHTHGHRDLSSTYARDPFKSIWFTCKPSTMLFVEIYVKSISNFSLKNYDIRNNPESFLQTKQTNKAPRRTKRTKHPHGCRSRCFRTPGQRLLSCLWRSSALKILGIYKTLQKPRFASYLISPQHNAKGHDFIQARYLRRHLMLIKIGQLLQLCEHGL